MSHQIKKNGLRQRLKKHGMKTYIKSHGIRKPSLLKTHSFQVFLSFVLFSTLLTGVYGFFTAKQTHKFQESMMRFQTEERLKYIESKRAGEQIRFFMPDKFMTVYEDVNELPGDLPKRVSGLDEGVYFTRGPEGIGGDRGYGISVVRNPETGEKNYYLFHEWLFEKQFKRREKVNRAFFKGWIVAFLLSIIIGILNARRLISPGKRLIDKVLTSDPENLPVDFAKDFKNDEIGVLATVLERSNQRVNAFIEREKQLTRDASHELRTPVTVIKGAVELLQQMGDGRENRPLARIDRAVRDMEVLIEVMLIRAREEESNKEKTTCNVKEVARKVVDESRYLLEGKPLELEFDANATPEIRGSEPELKMMLSNIVRNAINYTESGSVKVAVFDDYLEISDTGKGIDPDIVNNITAPFVKGDLSCGYGLGLSIVNRICTKYGWKLDIKSSDNGTRFRICFS